MNGQQTTSARWSEWLREAGPLAVVYLLATWLTDAFFMADTADYVRSILLYDAQGNARELWEFAHLYYRPLGWLGFRAAAPLTSLFVGPEPRLNVLLVLVALNWMAGLACVLLLARLLRQLGVRGWSGRVVVGAFICAQGFLNYAQAGSPYTLALAFMLLGLYLLVRGADEPTPGDAAARQLFRRALPAGVSLACAVCCWVMFLYALPAALGAPLFLVRCDRRRVRLVLLTTLACAACIGFSYLCALAVLHVTSLAALRAWMSESAHGNNTRGVLRMLFGLARSFINMGNDGMLVKRYLLHDPYNPVSLWTLVRLSLWKLALFYLFLAALTVLLVRTQCGRRALIWASAGSVPVLLFAIFFDGGAVERYLPLYPLVFVALAVALKSERRSRAAQVIIALFIIVLVGSNTYALARWTLAREQETAAARVAALRPRLNPASRLVTVTWLDDLVNFNRSFPFHPINAHDGLQVFALVTPGTTQVSRWRADFAALTLQSWRAGGDVWLSTRALADRPQADWNWVEGDDRNVRWTDFPAFFRAVELGETIGGADGFRRVLPTPQNEALFERLAAEAQQ